VGRSILASLFYDDHETLGERIKLITAVSGATDFVAGEVALRPARREPDMSDVVILGSIGWPTRKTHKAFASETGLSVKTG
jgi:hypothetical protein